MQNPNTITSTAQVTISGSVPPEIREALRTLRAASFRLEAEYYSLDWESRIELAGELRSTLDDREAD